MAGALTRFRVMAWIVGVMLLTGAFSTFSYWLLETFPGLATLG